MYWNLKFFEFIKLYFFYFKSVCNKRDLIFVIKFFLYECYIYMDQIDKVQFGFLKMKNYEYILNYGYIKF